MMLAVFDTIFLISTTLSFSPKTISQYWKVRNAGGLKHWNPSFFMKLEAVLGFSLTLGG